MPRPLKPNTKELMRKAVQSYVFTSARFKYTLTEHKIRIALMNNLRIMNGESLNIEYRNNMFRIHHPQESRAWEVEMPISDVLQYMDKEETPSKNYNAIKRAARNMQLKIFEVENTATGDYWGAPLIMNVWCSKHSGIMKFAISDWVLTALLDFTKGYREFELPSMMHLNSPYAMRMYELISKQKEPLTMKVEDLKEWFGIQDKKSYNTPGNFKARILDPSKKELDDNCPYSFEYTENRINSKNPRSEIKSYTFYPKFIQKNRDSELEKKELTAKVGNIAGTYGMLDKAVSDYLLYNLNMTKDEINANKALFLTAQKELPNLVDELADLKERAAKNGKGIGWIINGLKGQMKEKIK